MQFCYVMMWYYSQIRHMKITIYICLRHKDIAIFSEIYDIVVGSFVGKTYQHRRKSPDGSSG